MPENAELIVIENPELKKVVEANASIGLTKAQAHAVAFAPFMNKIHELSKALSSIDKNNPSEIDTKIARRCRLDLVPNRTGADKKKKELKESLVSEEKVIDALFNVIKHTSELVEAEYEAIEKYTENKEKERKENLRVERTAELSEYTEKPSIYPLGEMEEKDYQELKEGLRLQKQAKIEAERKSAIYQERKEVVMSFGALYDSETLEGFIPLTVETTDTEYINLLNALEEAKQKRIAERAEAKRLDELQRNRERHIAPYIQFLTQEIDLRSMPDSDYQTLIESLHKAKADYDLEQENIRKENERQKKLLEEKEAIRLGRENVH